MEGIDYHESPLVVVLSESLEPGFERGDTLFLQMSTDPILTGDIVVFNDGREIPIVHRVIEVVHERRDTAQVDVLTKALASATSHLGTGLYLPKTGWVTLVRTEKPVIKSVDHRLL
uniref:Signal peptidase complex catalytic subunit SEC11 n=1 Tax=Oryza punctata TaxID=4537 RepID=A0A0E0K778_ORYPU